MNTRRSFSLAALGTAIGGLLFQTGLAQPAGSDGLQSRGAPLGRIGAATRGQASTYGALTLDLVAPLRGDGLTSIDQPSLYYLLSGRVTQPMRFAIITPGQSRPLAQIELRRAASAGPGVVRLRDQGVRLTPNRIHVWSVELVLDPSNPSGNLVAQAPIEYRPADPTLERAVRETPMERRYGVLARAGYWYDAIELAQANRDRDGGAAFAELLVREKLQVAAGPSSGL